MKCGLVSAVSRALATHLAHISSLCCNIPDVRTSPHAAHSRAIGYHERASSHLVFPQRQAFSLLTFRNVPPAEHSLSFRRPFPPPILHVAMMHFDGRPLHYYLKSYRRRAGLTQKELAYLLGAGTRAKVAQYEAGLRTPSLESSLAYEAALGEPVAELFRGRYEAISAAVEARRRKLEELRAQEGGAPVGSVAPEIA